MKALLLIGCGLFMAFMAFFQTGGMTHAYAAIGAVGAMLLSLR
jgi:hypothetical protein